MPAVESEDAVAPDMLAIARFLGLIEGRLHVPIPKAWEEAVKSARGLGQKNIWFPPRMDLAMAARSDGQRPLERHGAHWQVKTNNQLIELPADDGVWPFGNATVECAGKLNYVAVYGGLSDACKLFAVDQIRGKVIWSSNAWGKSKVRLSDVAANNSGSDWHYVMMRLSGEWLVVFGFSSRALYVEAFDRTTGENRCRFSTAYFDFDPIKPRK
jgi:hypothetical protein